MCAGCFGAGRKLPQAGAVLQQSRGLPEVQGIDCSPETGPASSGISAEEPFGLPVYPAHCNGEVIKREPADVAM